MVGKKVFEFNAILVANEFIDKYMPDANGDYVKVYLYLQKNGCENPDISLTAEDLHLTERDVCHAIKFWQKKGLLSGESAKGALEEKATQVFLDASSGREDEKKLFDSPNLQDELRNKYRSIEGKEILDNLATDGEFAQLLFIVQKYLSKILTERDQEVIAFLYDGLKLPFEVIDYLVEYCVSKGHNNIRYIETAGMNWASLGIDNVRSAQQYTKSFDEVKKRSAGRKNRKSASALSKGMTRDTDLDGIVKERVRKRM